MWGQRNNGPWPKGHKMRPSQMERAAAQTQFECYERSVVTAATLNCVSCFPFVFLSISAWLELCAILWWPACRRTPTHSAHQRDLNNNCALKLRYKSKKKTATTGVCLFAALFDSSPICLHRCLGGLAANRTVCDIFPIFVLLRDDIGLHRSLFYTSPAIRLSTPFKQQCEFRWLPIGRWPR